MDPFEFDSNYDYLDIADAYENYGGDFGEDDPEECTREFLFSHIERETERAYCFAVNGQLWWVPKTVCYEVDEGGGFALIYNNFYDQMQPVKPFVPQKPRLRFG